MEERTFLSSQDFYESKACNKMRGFEDLNPKKDTSDMEEAVTSTNIFKNVVKMFEKGGDTLSLLFEDDEQIKTVAEVKQIVTDSFKGQTNCDSEAAEEELLAGAIKGSCCYCRWSRNEGRRDDENWKVQFDPTIYITHKTHPNFVEMVPSLKEKDIRVHFDMIYRNDEKKIIEGIICKGGHPWLSTSAVAKRKAEDDLWMNICVKALETLVPEDDTYTLRASYYHMLPNAQTYRQQSWDILSFDQGGHIVTLEESFSNTEAFKMIPTALDQIIKPKFEEFNDGYDCDGSHCQGCFLDCSCNFIKAPEELELKENVKKGKKPDPSDAQKEIIEWEKGIMCVIAGAGAGKTECSTEHIISLICKEIDKYVSSHPGITDQGALKDVLSKFFMTTFTNAGVNEMIERIIGKLEARELYADGTDLNIMTFNTFAYNIDKNFYEELGFAKEPMVIDDIRNFKIIVDLVNENPIPGLNYKNLVSNTPNCRGALVIVAKAFDEIKKRGIKVGEFVAESQLKEALGYGYMKFVEDSTAISCILDLYNDYEQYLLDEGLILFSDQEPMAMKMLEAHPDYLEELGYVHLVVDEFQDSNNIQMQFVKKLCSTKCFESCVVVGDDFQAIYGFRDTTPENILHFQEKIGLPVKQHFLVDNYRSVPEIIDLSNAFIKNNEDQVPKDLVAFRKSLGKKPIVRGFYDKDEEYDYIVQTVQRILSEGTYSEEDIAIIVGSNEECTQIGAKLTEADIPIIMRNPQKYLKNSRVQAAVGIANAIWDPEATENYFRFLVAKTNGELLKEYTSDEIMDMMEEMKNQFRGFSNLEYNFQRVLFHQKLDEIRGNDEIYEKFLDLLYACEDFPSELDYIQDFKKYGRECAGRMESLRKGVTIVTAHSSKGLEWPVVINGIDTYDSVGLHVARGNYKKQQTEEKRRLLYVSMTRARDELYIVGKYNISEETKKNDVVLPAEKNMFLQEIFDILDPDGYIPVDPNRDLKKQQKKEAAEAAKAERERRKLMRQSHAILAQYKGDKQAAMKAANDKKHGKTGKTQTSKSKSSKSRPLTDGEKLWYNDLVKDSKQMTMFD